MNDGIWLRIIQRGINWSNLIIENHYPEALTSDFDFFFFEFFVGLIYLLKNILLLSGFECPIMDAPSNVPRVELIKF